MLNQTDGGTRAYLVCSSIKQKYKIYIHTTPHIFLVSADMLLDMSEIGLQAIKNAQN